jgi:hypothetical protein
MQKTLPNGKWRKRLKIKALPLFAELHKVRAGNCKIFEIKSRDNYSKFLHRPQNLPFIFPGDFPEQRKDQKLIKIQKQLFSIFAVPRNYS